MGMITGIEEMRGRVTIYVDGVAFLKLKKKEFDEIPVCEGDDLDEEDYVNRLCARQANPAYESALNLLTARDMTAHDLKSALRRRGYLDPVAESVCERLIENRLINDSRYAQRYVELRQDAAVGRYAMKRKLRAKGIDEDELMMTALDAGADDVEIEEGTAVVYTDPDAFSEVRENMENAGYSFLEAERRMVPDMTTEITNPETVQRIVRLIDELEDYDDTQNVYHDAELPEDDEE